MIKFTKNETKFLKDMEECRLATSHDDVPHVKPVSFIFDDDRIIIATDYETRTYKNLSVNPKAAICIDVYDPKSHKAVLIQGDVSIIENGEKFRSIYKKFHDLFDWVRSCPWEENEAPFLEIIPTHKVSWGL